MSDNVKVELAWLLLGFACMVGVTSCTVVVTRASEETVRACIASGNEWRQAPPDPNYQGRAQMECRAKATP